MKSLKSPPFVRSLLIPALSVILPQVPLLAANGTWTGATDGNFYSPSNWNPGVPGGAAESNSDTAFFNASVVNSAITVNLPNNWRIGVIEFQAGAGAYHFSGATLHIDASGAHPKVGGAGIYMNAGVTASQTFTNLVSFGGGNPKLRNDSTTTSATLNLGNVTNYKSVGAASNLRLQGSNQGDNTVSGAISFTPGRVVNLIKEDAGKWILSGGNTYTGTTRVEGGTLVVSGSGSVNTSSSVTIDGAGALLRYEGSVGLSKDLSFGSGGGTLLYNSDAAYSGAAITASANHIVGGSGRLGTLTIASGGQLTPGASGDGSTGTLSLSLLTLQAGAETRLDLLSASLYDSVAASSSIALGGVLNLNFGSGLGDETALTLFSTANLSGSFSSVNALGAYSGSFSVEDGIFSMASGDQLLRLDQSTGIFSVHTQAIPEPSTFGILAAALAGVALLRRRKR